MAVKITVHRGTDQIGGSITEIATEKTCLFIDFGQELSPEKRKSTDDKMVEMMKEKVKKAADEEKKIAVFFTHIHGDHIGLLDRLPEVLSGAIQLGAGENARKCMMNIHRTLAERGEEKEKHKKILKILEQGEWVDFKNIEPKAESFTINNDIIVTPISSDHSAFDSYMFIVEAEGKCILHTGDFRTHGRLGKDLLERLEKHLERKSGVDVLLTEGTMMSRESDKALEEEEMKDKVVEVLSEQGNKCVFVVCSSTNVESLASFHNALMEVNGKANMPKRRFYVNDYVYEQLMLFSMTLGKKDERFNFFGSNSVISKYDFDFEQMKNDGFVMLIGTGKGYHKIVDIFKGDTDPLLIYSMWKGYIEKGGKAYDKEHGELYGKFSRHNDELHTAGHAYKGDIEKMIRTVNPKEAIIPIHTERKQYFKQLKIDKDLLDRVAVMSDGDTYYVGIDRQGVADEAARLLENTEWQERYSGYISKIEKNEAFVKAVCKAFHKNDLKPLKIYLTVGRVKDASRTVGLDLRLAGHSVGTITVSPDNGFDENLSGEEIQKCARVFFKESGLLKAAERVNVKRQKEFVEAAIGLCQKQPEDGWTWQAEDAESLRKLLQEQEFELTSEHSVETTLLDMLKETDGKRKEKNLIGIQPCTLCGQYYQLCTPLKGSRAYNNILKYSGPWGKGPDILAHARGKLCVIELKDTYEEEESPEKAIKQAIAYATFIIKLLRSKSGTDWYRQFGLESSLPDELTVTAVIAMPYPENWKEKHTDFVRDELNVEKDIIKLHYMYFKKIGKNELKEFETSLFDKE